MPTFCPQPGIYTPMVDTSCGPLEFLELGQGPPVLYFHGTAATGDVVAITEHALVADGFRLIVPHRPGYHGTPLTSGRTPQAGADLAAALLDRMDIDRVAVIGTSGGGPAAVSFAARHAQRTAAVVLQCAVTHPFNAACWMSHRMQRLPWWLRNRRFGLPVIRLGFRRELRKFQRDPMRIVRNMSGTRYAEICDDPATHELAALLIATLFRCAVERVGLENDWGNTVGKEWLESGSIRAPTIVIHDRADPLVPFAHAEWAVQTIGTAQLCDLHVGGHLIWLGREAQQMRTQRAAFLHRHLDGIAQRKDTNM
jgi:pimeloyl-ACP methyl ester carboxylesterase